MKIIVSLLLEIHVACWMWVFGFYRSMKFRHRARFHLPMQIRRWKAWKASLVLQISVAGEVHFCYLGVMARVGGSWRCELSSVIKNPNFIPEVFALVEKSWKGWNSHKVRVIFAPKATTSFNKYLKQGRSHQCFLLWITVRIRIGVKELPQKNGVRIVYN